MKFNFRHILTNPLFVAAHAHSEFANGLLLGGVPEVRPKTSFGCDIGMECDNEEDDYDIIKGVALIPVIGPLLNSFLPEWCNGYYCTGYQNIQRSVADACNDPRIKSIVLLVDSRGGEAVNCLETGRAIRMMLEASGKPNCAIVKGVAYSAGMALAAATSKIYCLPSGGVGSIGALLIHSDYSKALEGEGIKTTLIYHGSHKADGNPYEPLPEAVKADMLAKVDAQGEMFDSYMAEMRGVDKKAIVAMQAATFTAAEGLANGLIDVILPPSDAFTSFESSATPAATSMESPMPQADAETVKAERARIKAIQQSEAAAGRAEMASYLAFETDMSADAAVALLSKAPAAAPAAPTQAALTPSPFLAAMNAVGGAGLAPELPVTQQGAPETDPIKFVLQSFKSATGRAAA